MVTFGKDLNVQICNNTNWSGKEIYFYARDTHQYAVEELVDKQSQSTDQHVGQVVQELYIHYHGFVTHDEGAVVSHEAHHVHNLIEKLFKKKKYPHD